ncbi:MAG TPA: amidase [Acidimicrobiales bacterium]|nr:amidase [Acidimicrobiales bacterium]
MAGDFDTFQTARATAAAIRAREVSPLEVLDACLARVDAVNDSLNALIWRNDEEARQAAVAAGDALVKSRGEDLPPFHGVPIPIKDLTPVAGWPVTYGSWGADGARSETSDLVVEAFKRAGFILTGRTNTPEFGATLVTENDRYGITRNPWDLDRTAGGSSGGAAAAVAGGLFPIAHGNDGGGSIRVPASCCGLVGLKVSRGRVPSLVIHWEGAAVEGILSHDVADTAAVLDSISGPDALQWYNAPGPERPFLTEVGADPGRLRVGLVIENPLGLDVDEPCAAAAGAAAIALEKAGHHVEAVMYEVPEPFLVAFLNVVNSGLAGHPVDWDKTEPHIRAERAAAQAVDSLTYVESVQELQRWSRDFIAQWGRDFDVLLSPTMSIEPPRAGEVLPALHAEAGRGIPLPVLQMAVFVVGHNVNGLPAISLPTHVAPSGLPVGVQLVAGPWREAQLFRVAAQLEEALPWSGRRPVL